MYVLNYFIPIEGDLFIWTGILTTLAFILIGLLKSHVTETSTWKGVMETLGLGILAATLAYTVGDLLEKLISG